MDVLFPAQSREQLVHALYEAAELEHNLMLAVRDGPLSIDPQIDGPLQVRGNLDITSGTGRVVARVTTTRLCRCGGSNTKPFCDGSHARIGFKSN
jgi:CDGSH-type Zn-finger protein